MNNRKAKKLTHASLIAGLYVVLTLVSAALGLSGGVIQVRFSEALTILPCFSAAAVPGLGIGCIIANMLTGAVALDVIFGSVATLLGAMWTRIFRKNKYVAILGPIVSNTIIIPLVLRYAYNIEGALWYFSFTVCIGEVISCGIFGLALYKVLDKNKNLFE